MKVYISGPITNNPDYMKDFQDAEDLLLKEGNVPVNPTKISPYNKKKVWSDYMKDDIKALMDCDAIYLLHGWTESRGARLEHELAVILDLKIFAELVKNVQ